VLPEHRPEWRPAAQDGFRRTLRDRAGRGGHQQRPTSLRAPPHPEPGRDRNAAGAPDPAQQQGLAQLDPAQAALVDADYPVGDQTPGHLQGPCLPDQQEVPEGEDVAQGGDQSGQHREADQDGQHQGRRREGSQPLEQAVDGSQPVRLEMPFADDLESEPTHRQHGDRAGEAERPESDPARAPPGQLTVLAPGEGLACRGGSFGRLVEELLAHPGRRLGAEPIQAQPAVVLAV